MLFILSFVYSLKLDIMLNTKTQPLYFYEPKYFLLVILNNLLGFSYNYLLPQNGNTITEKIPRLPPLQDLWIH